MSEPEEGEGWKNFTRRRWDYFKTLEIPTSWYQNKMVLSLIASEYRLNATPLRAGEKPKNPGRIRKLRRSISDKQRELKRKQRDLRDKEHEKQRLKNMLEKVQLKIAKTESLMEEMIVEIGQLEEEIANKTKEVPKHMVVEKPKQDTSESANSGSAKTKGTTTPMKKKIQKLGKNAVQKKNTGKSSATPKKIVTPKKASPKATPKASTKTSSRASPKASSPKASPKATPKSGKK